MKFTYSSGSRPLEGYTIKRGVGHGGFGEVYYAVSDGGKEVAIKLIQRNLEVELRGVAQCMNLKHPNLVTIYDLRTNDAGEHFVVMEYVAGQSLADLLDANPNGLTPEDASRWLRGIISGVGYLHDKGIVHRDLKPGNIFMEDGVVKIGDYGLSKFITTSRRSGQTESVGTVHYMAPEIARGKYDRGIDIYAAGVILYEMLTGDVPFDGDSVGEILMKHLTAEPDLTRVPAPFDRVIGRALMKDPAARFPSVEQMAAMLNGRLAEPVDAAILRETAAYTSPSEAGRAATAGPACEYVFSGPYTQPPGSAPSPGSSNASAGAAGANRAALPPRLGPVRAAVPVFDKVKARLAAWWNRPWSLLDYLIAFPLGILLLFVVPLTGSAILIALPWVALGALVLWIVRLVLGPRGPQVAAVRPRAAPIALSPVAAPEAATNPSPLPAAPTPQTAAPAGSVVAPHPTPARVLRPLPAPRRVSVRPPKTVRTKLAELSLAMMLSAVLSAIAAFLVSGFVGTFSVLRCALVAGKTMVACWAVLIPSKVWEGRDGDSVLRRVAMMIAGMCIGAWAATLDYTLAVADGSTVPQTTRLIEGVPPFVNSMLVMAGYFGLALLFPRWWTLADGARPTRVNPWPVVVAGGWSFALAHLWSLPPAAYEWVLTVTVLTSLLVQVVSPWDSRADTARAA